MAVARSARRVPGARRERKASDRGRRVDARATIGFDEMKSGQERRYVMVGGKGGVGKTSVSASLGVSLAAEGHDVLVVSTDPAHSLSDSLAQDVNGREPRQVEGGEGKLWGLELDPEEARKEFSEVVGQGSGDQMREFMEGFGLGALADQLADLKLGELLETPPPGFDEALAISKVIQLANSPQYSHFSRVVFDTAPTGHTVRLLSLPDFLDKSVGKILRLRQKLSEAKDAVGRFFGGGDKNQEKDSAVDKLERAKSRLQEVSELFRDPELLEFVIVCIPTAMSLSESGRLCQSLTKEGVACRRLIVNQMLPERQGGQSDFKQLRAELERAEADFRSRLSELGRLEGVEEEANALAEAREALTARLAADASFCDMRRRDQRRALEALHEDPCLSSLRRAEAPLLDLELRGVPALQYFGSQLWQ